MTGDSVDISVVVPVYNAERYIAECLDSIETAIIHSNGAVEVLCVDDGSTDSTAEMLQHAADCMPLQVITQENKGMSAARNAALAEARGTYVLFVDADDMVHPDLISAVLPVAVNTQAQMTVFGFEEFRAQENTSFPREMCEDARYREGAVRPLAVDTLFNEVVTPNVWRIMWQRSFIEEAGLRYPEELRAAEDLVFVYEGLLAAERVTVVPERLYRYRRDDGETATRRDRGTSGLQALSHVRDYMQARGLTSDEADRQFANLVADTVEYNLGSAAGYDEFSAFYRAYQEQFGAYVQERGALLAPRYRDFFEASSSMDEAHYLWYLFDQRRSWCESAQYAASTARDQLADALCRAEAAEAEVQAVRSSRSYKAGNALMSGPAAVRDALKRKKG